MLICILTVQLSSEFYEDMTHYWTDEAVADKWDTMQRDFQCCGALNLKTGFHDWSTAGGLAGAGRGAGRGRVPESCCLVEGPACVDQNIFQDQLAFEKINVHGCMAVMKTRLGRDVAPLLLSFVAAAVLLALLSILGLVLASANVAAITRKEKRERDGLGLYKETCTNIGGHLDVGQLYTK